MHVHGANHLRPAPAAPHLREVLREDECEGEHEEHGAHAEEQTLPQQTVTRA